LEELSIEPDQRLRLAIERLPKVAQVGDHHLFLELLKLNIVATRILSVERLQSAAQSILSARRPAAEATPSLQLADVIDAAIKLRQDNQSLTTADVMRAWFTASERDYNHRAWTIDLLAEVYTGNREAEYESIEEVRFLLERLEISAKRADDFSFFVAEEGDRIVFRVASTLDDFVDRGDTRRIRRAVLTHFRDNFGGFTIEEIDRLETLIQPSRHSSEADLQDFFDEHPHFFRQWDFREIKSQVYLAREEDGPLVPDFILTDRELQKATVIELKLPSARVVVGGHNRDRFSSAVLEARAQLLEYRNWFDESANRRKLIGAVGMSIYRPRLAVVIGRSSDFEDEFQRQKLVSTMDDVEVVTYDEILARAYRRRLLLN
jgi:hypothetical protein